MYCHVPNLHNIGRQTYAIVTTQSSDDSMLIHSGAHRLRTASNSSRMRSALRSENRRSPSSAGTKGGVTLLPHSVARAAADASSAAPRVPSTLAPPSMRHQPRGLAALRQRTDSTQHCSGLPVKLPWCIATIVLTQLFVHVKNKQKIDASSQGSSRLSRSRILALSWDSHPPAERHSPPHAQNTGAFSVHNVAHTLFVVPGTSSGSVPCPLPTGKAARARPHPLRHKPHPSTLVRGAASLLLLLPFML